jgi:hypothetical protein
MDLLFHYHRTCNDLYLSGHKRREGRNKGRKGGEEGRKEVGLLQGRRMDEERGGTIVTTSHPLSSYQPPSQLTQATNQQLNT